MDPRYNARRRQGRPLTRWTDDITNYINTRTQLHKTHNNRRDDLCNDDNDDDYDDDDTNSKTDDESMGAERNDSRGKTTLPPWRLSGRR